MLFSGFSSSKSLSVIERLYSEENLVSNVSFENISEKYKNNLYKFVIFYGPDKVMVVKLVKLFLTINSRQALFIYVVNHKNSILAR